jgi:hypothetical protein
MDSDSHTYLYFNADGNTHQHTIIYFDAYGVEHRHTFAFTNGNLDSITDPYGNTFAIANPNRDLDAGAHTDPHADL